jgi:hypothetical protein
VVLSNVVGMTEMKNSPNCVDSELGEQVRTSMVRRTWWEVSVLRECDRWEGEKLETYSFDVEECADDAEERADEKMKELIAADKKNGVLAQYIADIGTGDESQWTLDNQLDSFYEATCTCRYSGRILLLVSFLKCKHIETVKQ